MNAKDNIPPALSIVDGKSDINALLMTTSSDPASSAAVTTAIIDAYAGVIITTTAAGNAQTIGSPTVTTAGKTFTVVNNDTSTNSIVVNGVTITPGKAQSFIWDGSAWGSIDLGASLGANTFTGTQTVPGIILSDAAKITYDVDLATDHTVTGDVATVTIGEAAGTTFGMVLYLGSDGLWYHTDSDAEATMPVTAMATATIAHDAAGVVLFDGWARDDTAWAGMTKGGALYASQTAGAMTQTAPVPTSTATVCIQTLGKAPSTNTATVGMIRFSPEQNYTVAGVDVVAIGAATTYTLLFASLTAVPITFTADHSSDQTISFAAPGAADIGKQFRVVKNGTGAGKIILDAPAGVTFVNSAGASTDGGTITSEASKAQSALFMVASATVIQQLGTNDGTWTLSAA